VCGVFKGVARAPDRQHREKGQERAHLT
jgi:hypothetical protein